MPYIRSTTTPAADAGPAVSQEQQHGLSSSDITSPSTRWAPDFDPDAQPWWRRAINALGEVGPHLQNIPDPAPVRAQPVSGGRFGFQNVGRWQPPVPVRLANWSEEQGGLYPRFYRPGSSYAGGGSTSVGALMGALPPGRPAEQMAEGGASPSLYRGPGGGQDDQMPAYVSPGEYIFSAGDVAMLGDGNNEEGARVLDNMRGALRQHMTSKREGHPPMARDPMSYLRAAANSSKGT